MSHLRWNPEQLKEIEHLKQVQSSMTAERVHEVANVVYLDRYGEISKGATLKDFPVHYRQDFYRAAESAMRAIAETPARQKIRELVELHLEARHLRAQGKRIVLAHGCFDWLHLGHLRHLEEARLQGDALIVTVTGDAFVRKGPERPIFKAEQRAEMIAALACVDWVAVNEAETAIAVITMLKPDVFAKGKEYATAQDEGSLSELEVMRKLNRRVHYTDQIVYSSSKLIRMTRGEHV